MPHKQLPFVVLAAWVILLRLTFYSLSPAHSLPLSVSFRPLRRPPCPVLWQPCQAGVWLRWEAASSARGAPGPCRVSPGVSLSLSGWLRVYRGMDATVSPSTCYSWPRCSREEHTHTYTHTHTHTHKLPSCLADFAQRPSRFRISSRICHHSPITPSICLHVHWFLQRNSSSFTQRGFYISADGRSGSTLFFLSFLSMYLLWPCLPVSARDQRPRGQEDSDWERPAHHSGGEPGWRRQESSGRHQEIESSQRKYRLHSGPPVTNIYISLRLAQSTLFFFLFFFTDFHDFNPLLSQVFSFFSLFNTSFQITPPSPYWISMCEVLYHYRIQHLHSPPQCHWKLAFSFSFFLY